MEKTESIPTVSNKKADKQSLPLSLETTATNTQMFNCFGKQTEELETGKLDPLIKDKNNTMIEKGKKPEDMKEDRQEETEEEEDVIFLKDEGPDEASSSNNNSNPSKCYKVGHISFPPMEESRSQTPFIIVSSS